MSFDSKNLILEHISHVRTFLFKVISEIMARSADHDSSMFDPQEKKYLDEFIPVLSQNEKGSDEHKSALDYMVTGRDHHFQKNRHHLEHHGSVGGMDLIDLIEWLCDQKAASVQEGNLSARLDMYFKKYDFPIQLMDIINNTVNRYFGDK
jgi:hypothetical protein